MVRPLPEGGPDYAAAVTIEIVPEPATLMLLAGGFALVSMGRRREGEARHRP